jgi:hypothetical protein
MAREDFENEEIATILNEHFVAIKVDREQRPDIDAQYMLAVQMMTGSGGWPLSVFLTPDRKPFYGGTYFPPAEFKSLLNKVVEVYDKQPETVRAQADKVNAALAEAARPGAAGSLARDILDRAVAGLRSRFDAGEGGFAKRPKFPEAPDLAFLLARYRKTGDKSLLAMATTTLDHMANGGIYDQLGGGFHRYSTDEIWRVPHFEKMLYDQAQLVLVYLDAYEITRKPRYKQIVEETLDFVARELRDKDGGFTCTLDADSEGEEGKFYLWTEAQVKSVLGDDAPLFCELYGVTPAGDLNGKSVLHVASSIATVALAPRIDPAKLAARVEKMRAAMLAERGRRVRPHTDDKVLASWNGLMLAAYARAARVLSQERYRQIAIEAARFLKSAMMPGGNLTHSYRAGKAEVAGLLEDHAYCALGLLELAEATGDRSYRDTAQQLARQMVAQLEDKQNGGFFATASNNGDLLTRMKDGEDNATPSPNGVAALVLCRLSEVTGDPLSKGQALRTVRAFSAIETRAPAAFPTLLTAYQELGSQQALDLKSGPVRLTAGQIKLNRVGTTTVDVRLHILPGWHINAHDSGAKYLINTTLSLAPGSDGQLVKVEYPAGKQKIFSFATEAIRVYEGEITLKATVRVSVLAKLAGLKFKLDYQACNERACMAPASAYLGSFKR